MSEQHIQLLLVRIELLITKLLHCKIPDIDTKYHTQCSHAIQSTTRHSSDILIE